MSLTPHNTHTPTQLMQRLNDIICALIAASVFLMIGLESANTTYPTHSGTQPLSPAATKPLSSAAPTPPSP